MTEGRASRDQQQLVQDALDVLKLRDEVGTPRWDRLQMVLEDHARGDCAAPADGCSGLALARDIVEGRS